VNGKTIIVMSTSVPRPFTEWWADSWLTRSDDNGKTWTRQVLQPRWRTYLAGRRHIGVALDDGTLVIPATWESSVEGRIAKRDEAKRTWESGVLVSSDAGKTWAIRGKIANCDGGMCDEPAIVKLKNGDLYMLIRTQGEWLMETRSSDQGRTWTPATRTTLQAHNSPAALWRLRNGAIVVVWNQSPTKRYPLVAAYSLDDGSSWSKPRLIADIERNAQDGFEISYPSVTEAPDGTILVTYQRAPGRLQGRDLKLARFNFVWLKGE
jgi:alpha-L-fucosidase